MVFCCNDDQNLFYNIGLFFYWDIWQGERVHVTIWACQVGLQESTEACHCCENTDELPFIVSTGR